MWIRTQDGNGLFQVSGFFISEDNGKWVVMGVPMHQINDEDHYELGIYETEEIAIEVLDQIQDALWNDEPFTMPEM